MSQDERPMEVGQRWAYRARRADPLVAVEVVRIGSKRPARVLVHFVADAFEGREEWVPPARLKVPWSEVAVFVAWQARWEAVAGAAPVSGTAEEHAALLVFDELIDGQLAALGYNATAGVTTIYDVDGLAAFLDVPAEQLRADPRAFEEAGTWVVPWPVTELIARRAAKHDPEPLMRHVNRDEKEQRWRMLHGQYVRDSRRGPERHVAAEFFVDIDERPYHRPFREPVRRWCGAEAVARQDELAELRTEVSRLGRLVEEAAGALRRAGVDREAARIERDLGVPVDELRGR